MADDNLEHLRQFCGVLAAANPGLQSLASQLDGLSHTLADHESGLREALEHWQAEVEALGLEATSSGNDVEQATQALSARVHEEVDTRIAALEQHVGETKDRVAHSADGEQAALASAQSSLQAEGFAPALTMLALRETAFGQWADELDSGFAPFFQELVSGGEIADAAKQTVAEITDATTALEHASSDLGAMQWPERDVRLGVSEDTEGALTKLQEEIHQFHVEEAEGWKKSVDMLQERIDTITGWAVKAIQEAAEHAVALVDGTSTAVERAEVEFERSAASGQSDEARAAALAGLAPQIATANEEILQINSVLEALKP